MSCKQASESKEQEGKRKNLARAVFDDDVAVLANGAGLLRKGLGGAGVGLGLEMVLLVRHSLSSSLTGSIQIRFDSQGYRN